VHAGERGDLASPCARGVDDVARVDDSLRRTHSHDSTIGVAIDADDVDTGEQARSVLSTGSVEQMRSREHGLHLHVLRVVDASGEVTRDVRLMRGQIVCGHDLSDHAALALRRGEADEVVEGLLARGDHESSLGVEFAGTADLVAERGPCGATGEREVELGAGLLVRDEDVALTGAGGASGDRSPIDDGDRKAGARARPRAARTDDAGTDDDDIRARDEIGPHVLSSRRLAQMPRT
jgi:hypothetical protein